MVERLFFALWPDTAVRRALAAHTPDGTRGHARPTHPADLHLTLVFLGPLEASGRCCAEAVAGTVREAPFQLQLDHVGHWPGPGVLWCAPSVVPDALSRLVSELGHALEACGVPCERRPYRPHVTLARGIERRGDPREGPVAPIDWPVSELVLAGGRGGRPPRYRVHRRWPLAV